MILGNFTDISVGFKPIYFLLFDRGARYIHLSLAYGSPDDMFFDGVTLGDYKPLPREFARSPSAQHLSTVMAELVKWQPPSAWHHCRSSSYMFHKNQPLLTTDAVRISPLRVGPASFAACRAYANFTAVWCTDERDC